MANSVVTCPHCNTPFEITDVLKQSIEQTVRDDYAKKYVDSIKAKEEQLRAEFERAQQRSQENAQKEVEATKKALEEMQQRFASEQQEREQAIAKKIREETLVKVQSMEQEIAMNREKLERAREQELALLKRQTELEEKEREIALETQRRISEERTKVFEEATQRVAEEHKLRDAEKDKMLADFKQQIDELKRKSELTSQQLQGEVQELELEHMLRMEESFKYDDFSEVKKGANGADITHIVRTQFGAECGTIVWESKRTKAWSKEWIAKIKDDMRSAKADIAVIVSSALPKEISHVGNIDGVWICSMQTAVGLGMALRLSLIQISHAVAANSGKEEKMELLYQYLSGKEFRSRVESLLEVFTTLREDLDKERTAMTRLWEKREKNIQRAMQSTAKLFGEVQGIVGNAILPIQSLELGEGE